jgi:hypothetical protein
MELQCGYKIGWDGMSWTLCRSQKVRKDSDERAWVAFRWYGTIEILCKELLQIEAGERSEVTPIVQAFREASDAVMDALKEARAIGVDYTGTIKLANVVE